MQLFEQTEFKNKEGKHMLVQNKGKYIRHFGSIMIIPGGNELNEEQAY